ncbi:hypothetical protein [Phaeodactylibacter sp.]|uniref:hypothetical protein n=1 Tax=Phaeodactylibacter sp. TaxID=1940289 RepID=UPI0025E0DBE3|nr:hypothetical protein [Phaeodactylibacter sp.]MCI4649095.1 hypothetical protein [Phaeodactylibacter sp.]MCI5093740.1 hypothetical protein [Phaeodactylibacter sp.]
MDPIFKKLNYKGQGRLMVINAPESFAPHLQAMEGTAQLDNSLSTATEVNWLLAFVTQPDEITAIAHQLSGRLEGDPTLWFAYPKKSSKKYDSEITRDHGWAPLGALNLEPVRQVAVDEDWSALRFRRVEHIKSMKRRSSMRISPEGKKQED